MIKRSNVIFILFADSAPPPLRQKIYCRAPVRALVSRCMFSSVLISTLLTIHPVLAEAAGNKRKLSLMQVGKSALIVTSFPSNLLATSRAFVIVFPPESLGFSTHLTDIVS